MNAAQIHLALNHAPLFLSIIGGLLLILAIVRKNDVLTSISLYMLVAAALFTAPVFLTGEGTEELVEKAVGVNEMAIESHEDMAKISLIVIIVTGVLALGGLLLRKKTSLAKILLPLVILFSLASFGTMAQTAHLGGLIRHTELQSGNANGGQENGKEQDNEETEKMRPAFNATDSAGQQQKNKKEEDDD